MDWNIDDFPTDIGEAEALDRCYRDDISWIVNQVRNGTSTAIECDKQVSQYLYLLIRRRLRDEAEINCIYVDGRQLPEAVLQANPQAAQAGRLQRMLIHLGYEINNMTEESATIVLPYLDLLTCMGGANDSLTTEARELLPLLYENPRVTLMTFVDPSFTLFDTIDKAFTAKRKLLGIDRNSLQHLITQRDARKFPQEFNFQRLYQYLSGLNPVRIREVLSRIEGVDFPEDDTQVLRQIRELTIPSETALPNVDLEKDIGGYGDVKKKIQEEILDILSYRETLTEDADLKQADEIIPKGMIFWGPPGTGKTFFAKAMATALNATIFIVNGPELKSMWVGKSEENIREVFRKARQSAPSIIVFDELDSFAGRRDRLTGNSVQHSMVNQLLTEMDGFRKEELVFVVGTTNFVESLDGALLRPGRFEMKIEIPSPEKEDRLKILEIYNEKMNLGLSTEELENIASRTGETVDPMTGMPYTGDHMNSICRNLKRIQIREKKKEFTKEDISFALRGGVDKKKLTDEELNVVAYHEAGHAVVATFLQETTSVERISVDSDYGMALGYVKQEEKSSKFLYSRKQLMADMVVLMGGREAEMEFLGDITSGSSNDIERANTLAHHMTSTFGMTDSMGTFVRTRDTSDDTSHQAERVMRILLKNAQKTARKIIQENRNLLEVLAETLKEKKVLEKADYEALVHKTLKDEEIKKKEVDMAQFLKDVDEQVDQTVQD